MSPPPSPPPGIPPRCDRDLDGVSYMGSVSTTDSGYTCLPWTTPPLTGVDERYYARFPYLVESQNWCRNPDGDTRPW